MAKAINEGMKQKKKKSEKKFKMAHSKKLRFSKSTILKFFSRKFHRLVLGLVRLNDAKGIDGSTYMAVRLSNINSKTAK